MFWYDDTFYIFPDEPNRVAFIADTTSDIANLPTTKTAGTPQGEDNVSYEPVTAGSVVFIISTSDVYMLNSHDSWIKQPKHGSSPTPTPTATKLSELEDVTITEPKDGDFLVYDETLGGWKNGEAETVVVNYEQTTNKPSINGVELDGNVSLQALGIATVDEPHETVSFGDGD